MTLWLVLLLSIAWATDPELRRAASEVSTTYAACQVAEQGPTSEAITVCEAALETVGRLSKLLDAHPEWPEAETLPSKLVVYETLLGRALEHLRRRQKQEAAATVARSAMPITNEGSGVTTHIRITREQIKVLEKVFFDTESAELDPMYRPLLGEVADAILHYPDEIGRVEVAGHSDASGDPEVNMELSQARAEAVVEVLIKAGVSPLDLVAKGYGETTPIATNSTPEGRERNRRVEFHILGPGPVVPDPPGLDITPDE